MNLVQQINTATLPQHLAIIMDGNGRWAKQKGLMRALGHESGTKSVKENIKSCAKLGIDFTEQKAITIQQEIRYNITAAYYNWLFYKSFWTKKANFKTSKQAF